TDHSEDKLDMVPAAESDVLPFVPWSKEKEFFEPIQQAPAVSVPENKFGENIVWFLQEFANADSGQLEYAELEIYGENDSGREGSCTITVQEICKAAAETITAMLSASPAPTKNQCFISGRHTFNGKSVCSVCG